ncbi:MAG: metallophosphatase domain-containing protein [Bacteroidia bacterium]|nr:metallophosphatase domain-containing protein [Bacteroidia bacterium]MDW8348284.1 metallophosphatase domain-containing protein [Bacteroidia bacterium]
MRLVCFSDTHGSHHDISVPLGDIAIHAGDFTRTGSICEVKDFITWYAKLPHKYKVLIAGNHDKCFETDKEAALSLISPDILYLEDSGVQIENFYVWGSPYTPRFLNWAFGKQRGEEILYHWRKIPLQTSILVTHAPPKNILDTTHKGKRVGCQDLADVLEALTSLRLHVFGHIHEARGIHKQRDCIFVNASVLDQKYKKIISPITVDL